MQSLYSLAKQTAVWSDHMCHSASETIYFGMENVFLNYAHASMEKTVSSLKIVSEQTHRLMQMIFIKLILLKICIIAFQLTGDKY